MVYTIVCGSGTVTLPKNPYDIYFTGPKTEFVHHYHEGGKSTIQSRYLGEKTLEFMCDFQVAGTVTNGTIKTTYLDVLSGFSGKAVTLSFPDSLFSGTWLMHRPEGNWDEDYTRYRVRLQFEQGDTAIDNIS